MKPAARVDERTDSDGATQRLMLVEFLFDDPYGRDKSEIFPFFMGQAQAMGVDARWVFCGIYSRCTAGHLDKHTTTLSSAEAKLLLATIAAFGPSHLIFSESLDEALLARLAEVFPSTEVVRIKDDPDVKSLTCSAAWLPGALGLPVEGWGDAHLADAVVPAYESHLIPPPAGVDPPPQPYVAVIGGPVCLYGRKLAKNRFYRDIELPGGLADIGCAFCRKRDVRYRHTTPPVELALRQCQAAAGTRERFTGDTFLIRAAVVALRFGAFMGAVLDSGLPPSRFLFSYRVDELLRVADQITTALPELARAGHTVRVYNPGIENFSPDENERFNKGITAAQVDQAVEHIRRWTRDHPGTFSFESFGMIIYTPWTTLEDVEINYQRLRSIVFPEIGIEWRRLRSKLQILPETAIARLALRDGALVDSFDGFHYWDGRCLGDPLQLELPWRFLHQAVADYYELVWRLTTGQQGSAGPLDDLGQRINSLFEARPDLWSHHLDFLLDALDVARQEPVPGSPAAILEQLERRIPPALPPPAPPLAPNLPQRLHYERPSFGSRSYASTPLARLLVEHTGRLRTLLAHLGQASRGPLPGWSLVRAEPEAWDGSYQLVVELTRAGERISLHLLPSDLPGPAFAVAGPLKVWFDEDTPLDTPEKQEGVRRLCHALAKALEGLRS